MRLRKVIPEGGYFPRGYGVAWRLVERDEIVCLPLGLNVLARWGRAVVYWLEYADPLSWERDLTLARHLGIAEGRKYADRSYASGYAVGRFEGEAAGRKAALEDLQRMVGGG